MLKNFYAITCKNHAIPSLHRDSFAANPEYSGLPGCVVG
jgi:hypothetical protein